MRLLIIFLTVIGFFLTLVATTTAQFNGTIPPATTLVITGEHIGSAETHNVAYADLDNDGDVDAFVLEGDHSEIWLNQGNGHYVKGEQSFGDSWQNEVALGDLDNDGDVDAFITKQDGFSGKPNEVWLNNGAGVFRDSGQRLGTDGYSAHLDVKLVDFDQDQDVDALVVANGLACGVSRLWLNDGKGIFTDIGFTDWSACHQKVAIGDLNGDQQQEFVFNTNHGSAGLEIWSHRGGNAFIQTQVMTDSFHTANLTVGDLDDDGDLDLLTAGMASNATLYNKVWFNDGVGRFSTGQQFLTSLHTRAEWRGWDAEVALTDFDQDGDLDVMTVMRFAHKDGWYKVATVVIVRDNNGAGSFTEGLVTYTAPVAPTSIDRSRIAFLTLPERLYLPFMPNGK
jgi:hypothetical protein